MLRISKLTDYAIVLLAQVARAPHQVHSAAELAQLTQLEPPTVSKLLKKLAKAGLIESFRGASGGYRLALAADRVSVAQIVEVFEGPLGLTACSAAPGSCSHEYHCNLSSHWRLVSNVVAGALRSVSLADLVRDKPVRAIKQPTVLAEVLR